MQEYNEESQTDKPDTPHPSDFGDMLGGMIGLYSRHFQLFLAIAAVYVVVVLGIDLISVFLMEDLGAVGQKVVMGVTGSVELVIYRILMSALMFASACLYLGTEITPGAALQRAGQRSWAYLGSGLLWSFAVVGLSLTFIGIPFAIYLAVRWGLFELPVVFEGAGVRGALRRSTALVKNTWWRVCGIIAGILLIFFMVSFILGVSLEMLLSAFGIDALERSPGALDDFSDLFLPPPEVDWFTYRVHRLANAIAAAVAMPIEALGFTLLYFDLRIRKENYRIETESTD